MPSLVRSALKLKIQKLGRTFEEQQQNNGQHAQHHGVDHGGAPRHAREKAFAGRLLRESQGGRPMAHDVDEARHAQGNEQPGAQIDAEHVVQQEIRGKPPKMQPAGAGLPRKEPGHVFGHGEAVGAEHGPKDDEAAVERRRAKKDPTQHDAAKGDRPGGEPGRPGLGGLFPMQSLDQIAPPVIERQQYAVQAAPDDKRPAGTVPQPAEQHGHHQIAIAARSPFAVPPQGDVQVILEKIRQSDVPTPPEINNVEGLVGRIEVGRQNDVEHAGNADGHVGIAGKIKINLQGIAERAQPRLAHVHRDAGIGRAEDLAHIGGQTVRDDDFLGQAKNEDRDAHRHVFQAGRIHFFGIELGNDLLVMQQRTGNKMREIGDEQAVMHGRGQGGLPPVGIDDKGNLREGEKGDAQGQGRRMGWRRQAEDAEQKREIFIIAQHGQIAGDADKKPAFLQARSLAGQDGATDAVVEGR